MPLRGTTIQKSNTNEKSGIRDLVLLTLGAGITVVLITLHLSGNIQLFGKPHAFDIHPTQCRNIEAAVVCSHRGGDGGIHMFEREVNRTKDALCLDIDVFPSKDGVFFVGHPGTLRKRIPSMHASDVGLTDLSSEQLKALVIPPLHKPGRRKVMYSDRIATLDEVIALANSGPNVKLISWEVKNSAHISPSTTLQHLSRKLKDANLHHKSAILDLRIKPRQAKQFSRAIQIACVYRDKKKQQELLTRVQQGPCDFVMPYLPFHDAKLQQMIEESGKPVISWIVDSKQDLKKAVGYGAMYLVSNRPLRLRKWRREWLKTCEAEAGVE